MLTEKAKQFDITETEGLALYANIKGTSREYVLYNPKLLFQHIKNELEDIKTLTGKDIIRGIIDIHQGRKETCGEGVWEVGSSAAEQSYGPLMYDIAMSDIYPEYMMSDRGATSDKAKAVWNYMFVYRANEFKTKQLKPTCAYGSEEAMKMNLYPMLNKAYCIKKPLKTQGLKDKHEQFVEMFKSLVPRVDIKRTFGSMSDDFFNHKYSNKLFNTNWLKMEL